MPEMFQCKMEVILIKCAGDILLRGVCIVVPQALRERVVALAHEGHPGMVVIKQRLRMKVRWPELDKMVEKHVRDCRSCLLVSASSPPEPFQMTEMPTEPWRHIAIDFVLVPVPTGEYILVTVTYSSGYFEVDNMRSSVRSERSSRD